MTNLKKVAFVLHPMNVSEFKEKTFFYSPFDSLIAWLLNQLSPQIVEKCFQKLPQHNFMCVHNLKSALNFKIDVLGIMCGVFPEEVVVNKEMALKKVLNAIKYAIRKGAQIIVLKGFTSIACNDEQYLSEIVRNNNVVITSGNTLTAALAIEGVLEASQWLEVNPANLTISIVGATGDIGSICAKILAKKFRKIILCSRNIRQDDPLVREISFLNDKITIENDSSKAIKHAEVVLLATSSFIHLINPVDIKPYSIICDVSLPYNLTDDFTVRRKDIFAFDGGRATTINCHSSNKKWLNFVRDNSIYGCVAEGLALGFERARKNFSINRGEITEANILEIRDLSNRNGFGLAGFSFHGRLYSREELNTYRDLFVKRYH